MNRTTTKKALTAGIARVMEPGCKFDYMLTLYGPQGVGKSALLKKLGGAWFSDSLVSVTGKEAYEALQGVWLMEMAELAATRKLKLKPLSISYLNKLTGFVLLMDIILKIFQGNVFSLVQLIKLIS
ncbi:virulence-associated E family protein [Staphylococcus aureus]|nr:virulence-associated E family protein [Staphylococcus aureus]